MNDFAWRRLFVFILPVVLLLIPYAGYTQIQTVDFTLDGMGYFLVSPVIFEGDISSGPLYPGWFTFHIDDTGWPPDTDKTARWNYIIATYFDYDPTDGQEHWDGYFPAYGSQFPIVTWHFTSGTDQLGGIIRYLIITINDSDHDGVVDQDELTSQAVAGNLHCHIEQNKGAYVGYCGHLPGTMNGTLANFDPNQPDILTISYGSLTLRNFSCPVPVEEYTWGAVKTIYSK